MNESSEHLTSETLQAYLEGELPAKGQVPVESHLATCARCASELEAWSLLFSELDDLPGLEPSPDFGKRVMAQLPARPPLLQRLAARTRALLPTRDVIAGGHLAADRLQEFLEGDLAGGERRQVVAHLDGCAPCRIQLQEWEVVFQSLTSLPRLEPSPGFSARVMEAYEASGARAPAPAGLERILAWGEGAMGAAARLLPSSRKGWGWLSALAAVPTLAILVVAGVVFSHPLITPGGLFSFVSWRVGDGLEAVAGQATRFVLDSPLLLATWEAVTSVAASPEIALAVLAAVWFATAASGWVLYRTVISPPFMAGRHA